MTAPRAQPSTAAAGRCYRSLARPVPLAVAVTTAVVIGWLAAIPTVGTDLSAQLARGDFAARYPGSAYYFGWYGGVHPAGYALLSPYLLAVANPWVLLACSAIACAAELALLFERYRWPYPRAAAVWSALALGAGVIAGRTTFTAGMVFALLAVLALSTSHRGRLAGAAGAALLASAISPVAGLFSGLAGAALLLAGSWAEGLAVAVPAGIPLLMGELGFRDPGWQPYTLVLAFRPIIITAVILAAIPAGRYRVLRTGTLLYLLGSITAMILHTPLGSNVERLGELLFGPLLMGLAAGRSRRVRVLLGLVAVGAASWQAYPPIRDLSHGEPSVVTPATTALRTELRSLHADRAWVEAVPAYGHWESWQLAGTVPLARGWERQVDTARNPVFYSGTLTAAGYRRWLAQRSVGYVVLRSGALDYSAQAEARLIRSGLPYLTRVWQRGEWTVFRVRDATPMVTAPARVLTSTPASVTVSVPAAGPVTLNVVWSRWLRVSGGATLSKAGPAVRIQAPRPGRYVVDAPY